MKKSELKKIIISEIKSMINEFHGSALSYLQYRRKYPKETMKNWALFSDMYKKDIKNAKTESELEIRAKNIWPRLRTKEEKEAYKMFLIYRRDVLHNIERENINELVELHANQYKKTLNEGKFFVFYNNKKHEIEADNLWDAKHMFIEQYKIPKSRQGLLAVISKQSYEQQDYKFN